MQIFWAILPILLLILLYTKYFERFCDARVNVNCSLERQRVVQDDEFGFALQIENRKLLALPIIKVIVVAPSQIKLLTRGKERSWGLSNVINATEYQITLTTSLICYQRVMKKLRFAAAAHGIYNIKARIYLKDLLGITTIELLPEHTVQLIVHPKAPPMDYAYFVKTGLQGDRIIQRWIQPDPLFYTGVRPYETRDGFRDIDWKATAKMQSLQVKKYDFTSDTSIAAFILGDEAEARFAADPIYVESAVKFCSALCGFAYKNQYPVSVSSNLFINAKLPNINIPDLSLNHLTLTYDMLAGITNYHRLGMAAFLAKISSVYTPDTTLVFICKKPESPLLESIYSFKNKGYNIMLVAQETPLNPVWGCEFYYLDGRAFSA